MERAVRWFTLAWNAGRDSSTSFELWRVCRWYKTAEETCAGGYLTLDLEGSTMDFEEARATLLESARKRAQGGNRWTQVGPQLRELVEPIRIVAHLVEDAIGRLPQDPGGFVRLPTDHADWSAESQVLQQVDRGYTFRSLDHYSKALVDGLLGLAHLLDSTQDELPRRLILAHGRSLLEVSMKLCYLTEDRPYDIRRKRCLDVYLNGLDEAEYDEETAIKAANLEAAHESDVSFSEFREEAEESMLEIAEDRAKLVSLLERCEIRVRATSRRGSELCTHKVLVPNYKEGNSDWQACLPSLGASARTAYRILSSATHHYERPHLKFAVGASALGQHRVDSRTSIHLCEVFVGAFDAYRSFVSSNGIQVTNEFEDVASRIYSLTQEMMANA